MTSSDRVRRGLAAVGVLAAATLGTVPAVAGAATGRQPAPADLGPSAATLAARTETGRAASPHGAPTVTFSGHGDGGGIGLGQYGALGYAVTGHRWRWIVRHYYAGTSLSSLPASVDAAPVSVNLSELDGASVTPVRVATPGARLEVNGSPRTSPDDVTHVGRLKVVTVSSGDIEVDLPGVGWRSYQGSLAVQPDGQTWNVLPLEEYVAGVVPSESPASWAAAAGGWGEAALAAQAVAARSYAVAYVTSAGRICDTDACQSYRGDPAAQGLGPYVADVASAVARTSGRVMCLSAAATCPAADVAVTEYGASTGGWTEAGPGYGAPFTAVVDAGDAVAGNPYHDWSSAGWCPTSVPAATVAGDFLGWGSTLTGPPVVTARNGLGADGGRVLDVRVSGRTASGAPVTATVGGSQFASTVGLCSNWFSVTGLTAGA